jgi:heat shock protein HslJ
VSGDEMGTLVRETFRRQEHQVDGAAHELVPAVMRRVAARRRTRRAVAAALVAAATLAVIGGAPAIRDRLPAIGPAAGLPAGRTFITTSFTSDGVTRPVAPDTRIVIRFTATQVDSYAGCNHVGGPARLQGARLVFTDGAAGTLIGCSESGVMQQELWLRAFLSRNPTLRLSGNELYLSSDRDSLHLTDRRVAEPGQPLVGPTWIGISAATGGGTGHPLGDPQPMLEFRPDGAMLGFDGCDSFRADVTVSGNQITPNDFTIDHGACAGPAATVATEVARIMRQRLTYTIDADKLILTTHDGSRLELTALS